MPSPESPEGGASHTNLSAGVIDLRLLRPFLTLAEERHFTRAATRLFIAQPALSQQITRLERQLGVELFVRSPQGVSLTDAGQALREQVAPALSAIDAAVDRTRRVGTGQSGRLRVGFLSSLASPIIAQVAAAFGAASPGVELILTERSIAAQLADLRAGRVDVALFSTFDGLTFDASGLELETLAAGPQYVAVPEGHPIAAAQSVALAELAREIFVMPSGTDDRGYRGAVLAAARRHGFAMRAGPQADNITTMLGLVASGLGVTMVGWPVVLTPRSGIRFIPLSGERLEIVAARGPLSEAASLSLVAIARQVTAALVPA